MLTSRCCKPATWFQRHHTHRGRGTGREAAHVFLAGVLPSARVRTGCDFTYLAEADTPVTSQGQPRAYACLVIEQQRWLPGPSMAIRGYTDVHGNPQMPTSMRGNAQPLTCPTTP
jgi:hypothetical protein